MVQAGGGTLFLDEIGDMPPAMQAKLLRAIESRKVRPVGSDSEVPIDVRIVAATNRDLETDAEEGRFRRDLFFRINVIQIPVPPLRARGNDILLLAQHFLERAARAGKAVPNTRVRRARHNRPAPTASLPGEPLPPPLSGQRPIAATSSFVAFRRPSASRFPITHSAASRT